MIDIPLCYKYKNIINIEKKNKLEKYIIITNKFQLNMIKKCTQLLKEGRFKSCLKGYCQIINIAGYYPDINSIIPIFMITTTGKSEFLYNYIFEDIIKINEKTGHNIKDIPEYYMIDFESIIQNAKINGFFFHFS